MIFNIIEKANWILLQKNNRCITVLITALIVIGVLLGSGALAAAAPSVDASVSTFNSFYYYTGQNTYTMSDASASYEIKIPLYCLYYNSVSDGTYLNGYIRTSLPGYTFSFNGSSIAPSYFEVNSAPGLSCSNPTATPGTMTVYFDNHIKQDNVYFILGYYVFNFSEYTSLSISISPGAGLVNRNPTVSYMYQSTSEFGLAQAIVTALAASQDIDIILNGLQDISENTDLLNDVIDGLSDNADLLSQIYLRLGQMQSDNENFYSNIDTIIDSVSWSNMSYTLRGLSSDKINYQTSQLAGTKLYFGVNVNDYLDSSIIYYFRLPIATLRPQNIINVYLESNGVSIGILDCFFGRRSTDVFFTYSGAMQSKDIDIVFEFSSREYLYYNSSVGTFLKYISSDDIEYWHIYNTLQTDRLYNLLESYINANVSAPVDQAATQAAGLAQNQAAAEASLAALSPGRMEDLDSANAFDILDETANSTRFWTMLVNEFSISSGVLWGVFIFALMIGLIAFILRLR